jgi:glycosyltransferase involved in cell wall biosynthesis
VAQLNLEDRISFLGYVRDADLLALRRASDFFVIPSEADLQSLATMEAMACGLPVIAANAYALPELVHHEENGFLFKRGDSEEMAHYMDVLANDAELRARMGAESLKIIAKHDRTQVLDQWEEIYHRLSLEFIEAKARRLRRRLERKNPHYVPRPADRPRIRRTGDLAL